MHPVSWSSPPLLNSLYQPGWLSSFLLPILWSIHFFLSSLPGHTLFCYFCAILFFPDILHTSPISSYWFTFFVYKPVFIVYTGLLLLLLLLLSHKHVKWEILEWTEKILLLKIPTDPQYCEKLATISKR